MADSPPQDPRPPRGTAADSAADVAAGSAADIAADGAADAPGMTTLVLNNARLPDGRIVDLRIAGGRIESVSPAAGPSERPAGPGAAHVDLTGHLLLPAPAEPHAHLDSAFTAPGADDGGPAGPASVIGDDGGPGAADAKTIQRRATEGALLLLGHGATAIRSHVRIGGVGPRGRGGLTALEAVLQARRALGGLVQLTAVAVPRQLTGLAGADQRALLRDAVKMGAGVVGGCPDLDPDPGGYVEAVLEVADEHGCPVDLHTDGGDPARLARLASAVGGLRPGVTVSPCGGLARLPHEVAMRAADQLSSAGITVVALPQGGCGARERRAPARVAPVRMLRAAGVGVAAGSGALRDGANHVGRGDPLEAAYLLASHGEAHAEAAYEAVSARARTAMGLPEVRVEAGFPAELLAVRGTDVAGVLSLAYSRVVIHRGRVVARTSAVREYCDSAAVAELDLPRQSSGGPVA